MSQAREFLIAINSLSFVQYAVTGIADVWRTIIIEADPVDKPEIEKIASKISINILGLSKAILSIKKEDWVTESILNRPNLLAYLNEINSSMKNLKLTSEPPSIIAAKTRYREMIKILGVLLIENAKVNKPEYHPSYYVRDLPTDVTTDNLKSFIIDVGSIVSA